MSDEKIPDKIVLTMTIVMDGKTPIEVAIEGADLRASLLATFGIHLLEIANIDSTYANCPCKGCAQMAASASQAVDAFRATYQMIDLGLVRVGHRDELDRPQGISGKN
jgi:hypothetical protein